MRRSPESYAHLVANDRLPLAAGPRPEIIQLARANGHGNALPTGNAHWAPTPQMLSELAQTAGSASPERIVDGTAIDAGGLVPDLHPHNSWSQFVDEVDPIELLEVQLCNQTAPFILISRLRPALAASPRAAQVHRQRLGDGGAVRPHLQGPGPPAHEHVQGRAEHAHQDQRQGAAGDDGILMTAVDTGWITDERPHPTKMRLAEEGFHAPLDLVDGAARVYDPIVQGEAGEDLHGVFLKDFSPAPW